MTGTRPHYPRRRFLRWMAGAGVLPFMKLPAGAAPADDVITREIPSSGERLSAIGMGTWQTFDVGDDTALRDERTELLRIFFEQGGQLVDSSPMYGSSEEVLGYAVQRIDSSPLFSATKVWTRGRRAGIEQMEHSRELWGVERFDLMQIHNLVDWQTHLDTLLAWREEGKVRYLGITTSHGRSHDAFERIMREHPLDFVQITYNMMDRVAEQRLLPLARERGIAVLINRPFRGGDLFRRVQGRPLPGWAADIGCEYWSQVFLKFIISHPAVTCAIPATSRADRMIQNMGAVRGPLPDEALRERMLAEL
ncbi:aldo/keto reductase [Thioalkalivibrio denitrificans]|uniref:Aldo/keto reductase n=1 Tax=Thioalkalivibrio denitrificans TaxID=108003 RepID=A0A1V3NCU4_9GAMM|nr:aldo/keto reductase [Thioalkalivibrio denitrificans]OOG22917.1 aldo/keto reductase [Thioalkalivibrio denitrificans]